MFGRGRLATLDESDYLSKLAGALRAGQLGRVHRTLSSDGGRDRGHEMMRSSDDTPIRREAWQVSSMSIGGVDQMGLGARGGEGVFRSSLLPLPRCGACAAAAVVVAVVVAVALLPSPARSPEASGTGVVASSEALRLVRSPRAGRRGALGACGHGPRLVGSCRAPCPSGGDVDGGATAAFGSVETGGITTRWVGFLCAGVPCSTRSCSGVPVAGVGAGAGSGPRSWVAGGVVGDVGVRSSVTA